MSHPLPVLSPGCAITLCSEADKGTNDTQQHNPSVHSISSTGVIHHTVPFLPGHHTQRRELLQLPHKQSQNPGSRELKLWLSVPVIPSQKRGNFALKEKSITATLSGPLLILPTHNRGEKH